MRVLTVRSKELFLTIRVIVYCFKTLGLAPFSVQITKPGQVNPYHSLIQAFNFSKVGVAYNILLLIPITIAPTLHTPTFFGNMILKERAIVNIVSAVVTAEIILFIFTGCLILISWAFRQKSAACIMNRLLEVDVRLSGLKKRPFNKQALILLAMHIILNASMWTTYLVAITTYLKVDHIPAEIFGKLPEFIIHWFIIEYVTVIGLVSRDLKTVNKYLLDLQQFGNYPSRPPVRNNRAILAVSVMNRSGSQVASLKLLRNVRTTLSELCGDIADFFSLPILFSIACCFIPIFEKLYITSRTASTLPLGLTVCLIVMILLRYIYPIVSLTVNITRTKKEAGLTGQIVHKLLAEARTEEIKAELEQFSLQLLHEKVDFTAYGLFTLDSTLLQSMLAGVASYAIILMQFGSSDCNCNCNCNRNDTST